MENLPIYKKNRPCPKCGDNMPRTVFVESTVEVNYRSNIGKIKQEHLQRECAICGFAWPEAPLDSVKSDPVDGTRKCDAEGNRL